MAYWLMKSEPASYSIDDLERDKRCYWEGVRNYQARNLLRDEVKKGDEVLFYHSACEEPAITGLAKVIKEGYPDHTAWEKDSKYYDPRSSPEKPRWFMVDIEFVRRLGAPLALKELRRHEALSSMELLRRGSRLSVQRVSAEHFHFILSLIEGSGEGSN